MALENWSKLYRSGKVTNLQSAPMDTPVSSLPILKYIIQILNKESGLFSYKEYGKFRSVNGLYFSAIKGACRGENHDNKVWELSKTSIFLRQACEIYPCIYDKYLINC